MNAEVKHQQYNLIAAKLLDYIDRRSTDQADDIMRVDSRSYVDTARWNEEMEKIYKRLPILAAMSGELPGPGTYMTRNLLGVPLLLTRLKDGSVRAMLNVCAHRGMQVADGKGKCEKFSCPYHAWLYGNDGSLLRIYAEDTYGDVDKAAMSLTQLPVFERGGMIFAVLTPGLETDFEGFLGGMMDDVESLGFKDWHYCGSRVIQGANWKITYDGYLEGYHFAAAHPQTINQRTYSNIMQFQAQGPHLMIGFPQRSMGKLKDIPQEQWYQHENNGYDFVRTFFPNCSIFVAPEITQVAQLIPGPTPGENTTILHYIHHTAPATDEERKGLETMMDWLKDVVEEEDYKLGLKVQEGLASGAHKQVTFGRNERGNQYFHRWIDYYLSDDPQRVEPTL